MARTRGKGKNKFGSHYFFNYLCTLKMVDVAQLVRASDCGSEGRGFESHLPPHAV